MKKVFLGIFAMFFSLSLIAEDKVSEYSMSYFVKNTPYFGKKTYDIEASAVKNGSFTFYIYCEPKEEGSIEKIGFSLKSKEVEDFCNQLNSIKPKFAEWSKTAKDNNVTNYDKEFDTNFRPVDAFFSSYGSKWYFTYNILFRPYFKVMENGECLIVFNTGELTAASNRYMKSKGFLMAFKSEKEIDDFIKALNIQKVLNKAKKDVEKDNLFK